jgi:hypothetical protein
MSSFCHCVKTTSTLKKQQCVDDLHFLLSVIYKCARSSTRRTTYLELGGKHIYCDQEGVQDTNMTDGSQQHSSMRQQQHSAARLCIYSRGKEKGENSLAHLWPSVTDGSWKLSPQIINPTILRGSSAPASAAELRTAAAPSPTVHCYSTLNNQSRPSVY